MSGDQPNFFYRFNGAFAKEGGAVRIVFKRIALVVFKNKFAFKKVFVVKEIHLQAGIWERSHLDDQWVIVVVDNDVHPGKANHFVEPVAALVDDAITRHQNPHFITGIL